jgi:hypothetical protein
MPGASEVVIDKDSAVPATVADEIRRQAPERLALLDRFVRRRRGRATPSL